MGQTAYSVFLLYASSSFLDAEDTLSPVTMRAMMNGTIITMSASRANGTENGRMNIRGMMSSMWTLQAAAIPFHGSASILRNANLRWVNSLSLASSSPEDRLRVTRLKYPNAVSMNPNAVNRMTRYLPYFAKSAGISESNGSR